MVVWLSQQVDVPGSLGHGEESSLRGGRRIRGRAARRGRGVIAVITIVVEGGPEGIERIRQIDAQEVPERWTVSYLGRHQRFERTDATVQVGDRQVPVFRFAYSTAIAE